jgi:PAS domain S-box-containing protein
MMNDDKYEDELLHSVALQNANAILIARQRAERELAAERERLRITLASIGDAVISTDAEGRVMFANTVAESLTGWTQAEAAGRPLPDVFTIVDEHTRRSVENPALRALREGVIVRVTNRTILISRDGTERPIDDSAAPMRDASGTSVGAVLVFRDVTERRRTDAARAQLASIIESSEDAIVSKTIDGIIRSWNVGAERLFGYTSEEAVGRPITLIIPPDRLEEERMILDRLRSGERIEHYETIRMAKNGRRLDISLSVSPLRDADGRIVGASKVARDITDRKQAEALLRESARHKDEFLALLAHELRNPLAPLRNGLEAMRLTSGLPDPLIHAREMMDRQLSHLIRLVDDLLDMSRLSRGKMELRRSRIRLADVIASAVETARPLIDAAGHELKVTLPKEAVVLDADLTRLVQVVANLLTNSAKYTARGGRIWLTAEVGDGTVSVVVKDTGIGIPADALPRIFDMFSQVNRSIERTTGGLGIGLALVKGLVEMHGGTVSAESMGPDAGSTFIVRLPVASPDADSALAGLGEDRHVVAAGKRVLVVDDNQDGAESLAELIRLLGHEVHIARDGLEAVEAAERLRPHLILMDVGMPRLNGLDATRRIRDRPWGKELTIIALTGWGQEIDRERSREAGCDGHLVKPVGLSDLETLLAAVASG